MRRAHCRGGSSFSTFSSRPLTGSGGTGCLGATFRLRRPQLGLVALSSPTPSPSRQSSQRSIPCSNVHAHSTTSILSAKSLTLLTKMERMCSGGPSREALNPQAVEVVVVSYPAALPSRLRRASFSLRQKHSHPGSGLLSANRLSATRLQTSSFRSPRLEHRRRQEETEGASSLSARNINTIAEEAGEGQPTRLQMEERSLPLPGPKSRPSAASRDTGRLERQVNPRLNREVRTLLPRFRGLPYSAEDVSCRPCRATLTQNGCPGNVSSMAARSLGSYRGFSRGSTARGPWSWCAAGTGG